MLRLLLSRKLKAARRAREEADKALRDAVWRKDTRAQHSARQRLRETTHELMRLEVRCG
jgi:hypothetical protein